MGRPVTKAFCLARAADLKGTPRTQSPQPFSLPLVVLPREQQYIDLVKQRIQKDEETSFRDDSD